MIILGSSNTGAINYLLNIDKLVKKKIWILDSNKKKLVKKNQYTSIKSLSKIKKINLIITGSAIGNSIDKQLIKFGIKNNIFTVSIIEHWTNYLTRFVYKNKKIFPNLIFVNDIFAYKSAIKEGIPAHKLLIMGNIFFENFSKKKIRKTLSEWAQKIKNQNKKIYLYVSEEILSDKTYSKKEYELDEFNTLKKIIKAITKNDILIIKCHPDEKTSKYKHFANKNIIIRKNMNFSDIVNLPDKIIGIKSILLLQISIFRNDIISYRPNKDNQYIGDKIKCTKLVRVNLKNFLNKKITNNNALKNYFNGSSQKIKKYLKRKLQ